MSLKLYLLAEGVGLLSVVGIISLSILSLPVSSYVTWLSTWISWLKESVCCLWSVSYMSVVCFCLSLHSLPGFYLYLLAKGVGLLSLVGIISVCRLFLLVSLSCLYLYLLAEGVGLQYVFSIISVSILSLPVSTFVAWVSTCISWLKESVCCPILRLNSWILLSRLVTISNPDCVGAC